MARFKYLGFDDRIQYFMTKFDNEKKGDREEEG